MISARKWTAGPADRNATLVEFLARELDLSGKKAKALLDARIVFVNRRRVWMARHRLKPGDEVEVIQRAGAARPAPPAVLFEDGDYVIINKPAGLLANGPRSAEALMRGALGLPALSAAHRLDRDTSGCLLLAKTPAALAAAFALFRERRVSKTYLALVSGRLPPRARTVSTPIDGARAVTHIRVISARDDASCVEVSMATGRTHQIRRHLAELGHPLLGDKTYATAAVASARLRAIPRQMLHAAVLAFRSPLSGRAVRAAAPIPPDFAACLKSLGFPPSWPEAEVVIDIPYQSE